MGLALGSAAPKSLAVLLPPGMGSRWPWALRDLAPAELAVTRVRVRAEPTVVRHGRRPFRQTNVEIQRPGQRFLKKGYRTVRKQRPWAS